MRLKPLELLTIFFILAGLSLIAWPSRDKHLMLALSLGVAIEVIGLTIAGLLIFRWLKEK